VITLKTHIFVENTNIQLGVNYNNCNLLAGSCFGQKRSLSRYSSPLLANVAWATPPKAGLMERKLPTFLSRNRWAKFLRIFSICIFQIQRAGFAFTPSQRFSFGSSAAKPGTAAFGPQACMPHQRVDGSF
jgi:hypothetical protein